MRASASWIVAFLLALAGCGIEPQDPGADGLDPEHVRSLRADGFLVVDDGSLEPAEQTSLLAELTSSRAKILALLGSHADPGDFGPASEDGAQCPEGDAPGDIRIVIARSGARCHTDASGITLLHAHLARKDATHELVHYLSGASWRPIDEGFAVHVTEKLVGPAGGIPLDIRARAYMDVNMDEGLDRERLEAGMDRRDYDMAGSFVKFLIETRGLDAFLSLYHGEPGNYQGVYGLSFAQLVDLWRQRIRGIDVKLSSEYWKFRAHLLDSRRQ